MSGWTIPWASSAPLACQLKTAKPKRCRARMHADGDKTKPNDPSEALDEEHECVLSEPAPSVTWPRRPRNAARDAQPTAKKRGGQVGGRQQGA